MDNKQEMINLLIEILKNHIQKCNPMSKSDIPNLSISLQKGGD